MAIEDLQQFVKDRNLPRLSTEQRSAPTSLDNAIGVGRATLQGVTLGLGDELEAYGRHYLGELESWITSDESASRPYQEIVKEVRNEIRRFEDENPGVAITSEILGAVAPTVLMMLNPTGTTQPMATAHTTKLMSKVPKMFANYGRKGTVATAEGGIYAFGKGEKGYEEDIKLMPGGMAWGLGGTVALDTLFRAGRGAFNIVMNRIRERQGDKISRIAEKELRRLQQTSGLTIAEIVAGVQSGQLMVENQTLQTALRGLFSESGEAKKVFTNLANIREKETRDILEKQMEKQLTPELKKGENIVEYFEKSSQEIKKEAQENYDAIFKTDNFEAPQDLVDEIVKTLQARPDIAKTLNEVYVGKIVPPYKILDDGSLELVRYPTIKDAEIIRRRLDKIITKLYDKGDGDVAVVLKPFEEKLKKMVDEYTPRIGKARQKWANYKAVNKAYKDGQKSLGEKVEVLEYIIRKLKKAKPTVENQNILNAYRNGALISLKDKLKSPGFAGQVSDPNSKAHSQIRAIFPDEAVEDVIEQARKTNESIAVRQSVTGKGGSGAGSPTQQNLKEQSQRVAEGLTQGQDPLTAVASRVIKPMLDKVLPGIDDKSIRQVLEVLYEKNPEKVRQVLTGRTPMGELQELININMDAITRVLSPSIAITTPDTETSRMFQDQLNLLPVQ